MKIEFYDNNNYLIDVQVFYKLVDACVLEIEGRVLELTVLYPHRMPFTTKKVLDDHWVYREQVRFDHQFYFRPVWTNTLDPIVDHYCHVSLEDTTKVAFTPDKAKGKADIQTRISPGRYLKKFYPNLSETEIQELAESHIAQFVKIDYEIAETPEDMVRIYTSGPESCMSKGSSSYFCQPNHPIEAYGNSDLKLAYIEKDGSIKARAIVWPEKKAYVRIYGDAARLAPALKRDGYQVVNGFEGATINCLPVNAHMKTLSLDDPVILPYIDGMNRRVQRKDDKLIILSNDVLSWDYTADQTGGVSDILFCNCTQCGSRVDKGSLIKYSGKERVRRYSCRNCWRMKEKKNEVYQCHLSGLWHISEEVKPVKAIFGRYRSENDICIISEETFNDVKYKWHPKTCKCDVEFYDYNDGRKRARCISCEPTATEVKKKKKNTVAFFNSPEYENVVNTAFVDAFSPVLRDMTVPIPSLASIEDTVTSTVGTIPTTFETISVDVGRFNLRTSSTCF